MERVEWRTKVHTELREQICSTYGFLNPRVWSNGKTLAIMSKGPWFDSGCAHFLFSFLVSGTLPVLGSSLY